MSVLGQYVVFLVLISTPSTLNFRFLPFTWGLESNPQPLWCRKTALVWMCEQLLSLAPASVLEPWKVLSCVRWMNGWMDEYQEDQRARLKPSKTNSGPFPTKLLLPSPVSHQKVTLCPHAASSFRTNSRTFKRGGKKTNFIEIKLWETDLFHLNWLLHSFFFFSHLKWTPVWTLCDC